MHELKITKIGNSAGIILPKEVLARLKLETGDKVFLTDAPGAATITPHDPVFSDQMTVARKIMKNRREVLRELAK
jgi:putative addiction module antidote